MSNSRRKTKIQGIASQRSEKVEKQDANRKQRRVVKQNLKTGAEDFPEKRETSNIWAFGKDGKKYNKDMDEKDLRK